MLIEEKEDAHRGCLRAFGGAIQVTAILKVERAISI